MLIMKCIEKKAILNVILTIETNVKHIFICKYYTRAGDIGSLFRLRFHLIGCFKKFIFGPPIEFIDHGFGGAVREGQEDQEQHLLSYYRN